MLSRLFSLLAPKKTDCITVKVAPSDTGSLFVRLFVNDNRRALMRCVIWDDTTILISDIEHTAYAVDYNMGYGSMMMEKLLEFAQENGYSLIYGNLAECDLGHKDRLLHFYRKFGFIITEYPELQGNYFGKIELHLSQEK